MGPSSEAPLEIFVLDPIGLTFHDKVIALLIMTNAIDTHADFFANSF